MGMAQEPSNSPLALHLKQGKTVLSNEKCMLIVFFNTRRVVYYEFVTQRQNVNQHYHFDT